MLCPFLFQRPLPSFHHRSHPPPTFTVHVLLLISSCCPPFFPDGRRPLVQPQEISGQVMGKSNKNSIMGKSNKKSIMEKSNKNSIMEAAVEINPIVSSARKKEKRKAKELIERPLKKKTNKEALHQNEMEEKSPLTEMSESKESSGKESMAKPVVSMKETSPPPKKSETCSSEDECSSEEGTISTQSLGLLHWMRKPLDIDLFKECPVNHLHCLDHRLADALQRLGFRTLFPVQSAVWETTIGPCGFERDICVNSPTGSGKTLAYALPIVQMLSGRKIRCLRALIVVPTRDLATQVKQVFDFLAPVVGLHVGLAVGQSSTEKEISNLISRPNFEMGMPFDPEDLQDDFQSKVDILVATPGRLVDHINTTKGFSVDHLQYLVIDEVDRLVSEGYQAWLPAVLQLAYSAKQGFTKQAAVVNSIRTIRRCGVERGFKDNFYPRLVKMIFSATLTKDPSKLDQLDLHHALYLTSGSRRYSLPEKLESYRLICNTKHKFLYLAALLEDLRGQKSIIFTSSVELTHRLSTSLNLLGCASVRISEYSRMQKQTVRSNTLKDFREGKIDILVASDAMTRGMDVEGIKNVINYDMPPYVKKYIHRAGRTARAGLSGRCFTFLRKHEVKSFMNMLQKVGIDYCSDHKLPKESLERLQPICMAAVEKLIELESNSKYTPNAPNHQPQVKQTERGA